MMRNKDLKENRSMIFVTLLMCVGLLGIYKYVQRDTTLQSTRLLSLSVPTVVPLQAKHEQRVIFNDPIMSKNWGLMGARDQSIQADKAWSIAQGSKDIVVAVIDTGVDLKHPDLKGNLWTNPGETGTDVKGRNKATNGIDDDQDGYVDDVHGWDFVSNTHNLTDKHGHGTHIAGIIGAEGGNGIGISGVAPKVSIMILKYYDPKGSGSDNLKNTVRSIKFATDHGAQIINYSGGGLDYSEEEKRAISEARNKGVLFVAAAGNEYSNSDKSHYYPANYGLDNIISVTAMNPNAEVLKSSNFGVRTVHIAAPGEQIFSTLPNNRYGLMTGTSQATAFVSGVAALIFASQKDFGYLDVRKQILSTGDELPGMKNKTETSRKLNSWRALAMHTSNITVSGIVQTSDSGPLFTSEVAPRPNGRPVQGSIGRSTAGTRKTAGLSEQLSAIGQVMNLALGKPKVR